IIFTVNSFMGYNVSVSNANSRIFYRFARDGILFLPRSIGKVHTRYGSPHISAFFVFLLSLIPAIVFGLIYGPETGGLVMLFANAYSAYTEHIIASVGLPLFARKRGEFRLFQHLIFPAIAIGVLGAVIFFSLYPAPPPYPYDIAAFVGIGWIPLSGILTLVEWKIHPERVRISGQHNMVAETEAQAVK
ncbi:MAG: amino acid permease, partial [Thermoplasmataceae archaeon]